MQFYLNGYRTGDPEVIDPAPNAVVHSGDGPLPSECDVLIVGCGPAGLTLAAQLAQFSEIKTCIVDVKSGPLKRGQADGVACRTVEMFHAFGFSDRVLRESYWVNEASFWKTGENGIEGISRTGWVKDTEEGLSEFPHVILNQARVHEFYLDVMKNAASKLSPHYNRKLVQLSVDKSKDPATDYPVTASLEFKQSDETTSTETIKAKYVVGCDGARSAVRKSIGHKLKGDSANSAWGVMDILAVTDFPDVRFKCIINSPENGSIVLIPREGGYLIRVYVEVDKLQENERAKNKNLDIADIIAAAQKIFSPYTLEVKDVAWWSIYEIGQRLCDQFDDLSEDEIGNRVPSVFIAGDACHTHSPKAGQGMNVSMQDAFNLGWKLAAVLRNQSPPVLLNTYSQERHAIAKELIDFDREWAAMLSGKGVGAEKPNPQQVQDYFVRSGRYTAGTATLYTQSTLTSDTEHQDSAKGFQIGTRLHSAPVVRKIDAKPMQLGHVHKADGRWRIYAFAGNGDTAQAGSSLNALCEFLATSSASPVLKHTPKGSDIDAVIDVRAIFQEGHRDFSHSDLPDLLMPSKGKLGLRDLEKIFCVDLESGKNIYDLREINRENGCMVIVRPDQYVATILPLNDFDGLTTFFEPILTTQDK